MAFIEPDVLPYAGPDTLNQAALNQSIDGDLHSPQVLPGPSSELANCHRLPCQFKHP
jgi:hypothetical protein